MHALFSELRFRVIERKGQIPYHQWLKRQGKHSKNEKQLHGVLVLRLKGNFTLTHIIYNGHKGNT